MDPTGGPIVNALVGVSHSDREAFLATSQPVPAPISIRALIDTGASHTCVDPAVLEALQLSPIETVSMRTASSGAVSHSTQKYQISLVVPGAMQHEVPLTISTTTVIATELGRSGFQALIGRDVLNDCMLVYNGSYGQFSLAF